MRFWQRGGGYDRNMVKTTTIHESVHYIHDNPVRRGLVDHPSQWRWSSAGWYDGRRDVPLDMDETLPVAILDGDRKHVRLTPDMPPAREQPLDEPSAHGSNALISMKRTKHTRANGQLELLPAPNGAERKKTAYNPLPSVWEGTDAELLERMLDFYSRRTPKKILDATVNKGRFWEGSTRPVTGLDIDPAHKPDIVGDNRDMPFEDKSFDVVVYDPPHIPNQGKDKSKDFNNRFGLVLKSSIHQGYNFSHLYPPFVKEAHRVLKPEGVMFCKIADYVHGHRFQWAHIALIEAALKVGFTACDCIVKLRKGPIVDPKWKNAHHARRQHCYWLIFRKSKKCE